ncbi:MAG: hypothetical protein KKE62_17670 [Proteobacteria bacterium]|nr:hypothetical protein [Pseudomonadota bacterium]MBU1386553.1 hypothetical protein [Pseudomonadota bacterium]MBU1544664.1 hypothetical protein [Pseudomonadota bacterium]MBU2430373.1 hypothetical protein [Pseudomonadota bacterium]
MNDTENLHLKVQELCDCFSTTDPLKEMSELKNDKNSLDAALKWLALSVLHGINNNAKEVSIRQDEDGKVSVVAEYRDTELPSPGPDIAATVFEAVREMTHIDGDKGKIKFAMGVRDSSLDLNISVKNKDGNRKISIKFP